MNKCPKCGAELSAETHAGAICERQDYCPRCKCCYGYKGVFDLPVAQPATTKALQ